MSLDTDLAGIEYIDAASQDSPWGGAMIADSLMVGHSKLREIGSYQQLIGSNKLCTVNGVLLPFSTRLTVANTTFVNFNESGCQAFGTCAHCKPFDGAAIVRTRQLAFDNVINKVSFGFTHSTLITDQDGTLVGGDSPPNATVLPWSGYLDPADCKVMPAFSVGINGSVCRTMKFAKIAWNEVKPSSIDEKDAYLTNKHGTDIVKWRKKSKTGLTLGYTTFLPINEEVTLSFQNSTQFTNVSYNMKIFEMPPQQSAHIKLEFKQLPDHFSTGSDVMRNNTYT